jgi:anaerobic selenocysteine-containing dehydrogenase
MEARIVRSNCGMCHAGCGILVHVEGGEIAKIEGDPECPNNKGTLCAMGLSAKQLVYHPDRLKYPMKRLAQRGEGKWQRISWDEALDTIAAKIKEIRERDGPLAVAVSSGTARPLFPWLRRFLNAWGSPNRLGYPHNCYSPFVGMGQVVYGADLRYDLETTNCAVIWGFSPTRSRANRDGRLFIEAFKRGARVISIDPMLTPDTARSDIWLQIRPGTDCAMALAWINVIIKDGLYDREFVAKWTSGFDRLSKHVADLTPEWAEKITWVPAEKIRQAARMYATIKPATIAYGVATCFGTNTTNTAHSIYMLPAITGNVDVAGGNPFWDRPYTRENLRRIQGYDLISKEAWENSVGGFPLLAKAYPAPGHAGWRAVLTGKPYPIKALLFHAGNPLINHENPQGLVYQALKKVEFISVMDHFMTPTAELADIVLPASTTFERDDIRYIDLYDGNGNGTFAAPRVIEPLWESRDDTEVFIGILKRVGLDYGFNSVREMLDELLKPLGISYAELIEKGWLYVPQRWQKYKRGLMRADGKPGFNTPSGKVELYSTELEKLGLNALPIYIEPAESPLSTPELLATYPLVGSTAPRSPAYFHSQYRQVSWLRHIHKEPKVTIHPQTAEKYGITDGDWVWIESPRGKCKQKARLSAGVDQRVVLGEHGWWFPEKPGPEHGMFESNLNLLVSGDPPFDPGFGSTPARGYLCRICKAEEVPDG